MSDETNIIITGGVLDRGVEGGDTGTPGGIELAGIEPWPEPVDGKALLDELAEVLRRYLVLPKWAPETLALWTVHTYAFQLRDVSAYLGIESPEKRCGKTTLLGVLSKLVNRPVPAANISSSAFFRVIQETKPTLLIDEADTFLRGNDELRGILNAGYSRETAYVVRVQSLSSAVKSTAEDRKSKVQSLKSEGSKLATFSCWCPKVMAAIGRLPDTLADRCIVIRMQRKTSHEQCERLRGLETSALRRRCERFVKDNAEAIGTAQPEIPEGLNDRAADIWEPLMTLADIAGAEWPDLARRAAVGLTGGAQENNPIGALLLDIFVLFTVAKDERMFTRELVEGLNTRFKDRPWMEMTGLRTTRYGVGLPPQITELWLARQLRPYGIRSKTVRRGEVVAKGYVQEEFLDVFRRYIPRSELEALREEWGKV